MRRGLAALTVVTALAGPGAAPKVMAQAQTVMTPAIHVGAHLDDNVLWEPVGQSDHVWRISPSLDLLRSTPRDRLFLDASWAAEWFSRHRELSSAAASQHASARWQRQTTSVSAFALSAAYDNTVNPTGINLATGFSLGRVRTWRMVVAPEYTHQVTPRLLVGAVYRATGDFASVTSDILTHAGDVSVSFTPNSRDTFKTSYVAERFAFEDAGVIGSHLALASWERRINPAVQMMAGAGVRLTGGRYRPTVEAGLSRRVGELDASVAYGWSQETALGVPELVDVHRLLGGVQYGRPGGFGAAINAGVYLNDLPINQVNMYRGSVEIVRPLWGHLAIAGSYSFDYQRGLSPLQWAGRNAILLDPATTALLGPALPRIRRSVVALRLVLSGDVPLRPTSGDRLSDPVPDPYGRDSQ